MKEIGGEKGMNTEEGKGRRGKEKERIKKQIDATICSINIRVQVNRGIVKLFSSRGYATILVCLWSNRVVELSLFKAFSYH